jgi:hypothetical protein
MTNEQQDATARLMAQIRREIDHGGMINSAQSGRLLLAQLEAAQQQVAALTARCERLEKALTLIEDTAEAANGFGAIPVSASSIAHVPLAAVGYTIKSAQLVNARGEIVYAR